MKLLEENIGIKLLDVDLSNVFWRCDSKNRTTKAEVNK